MRTYGFSNSSAAFCVTMFFTFDFYRIGNKKRKKVKKKQQKNEPKDITASATKQPPLIFIKNI